MSIRVARSLEGGWTYRNPRGAIMSEPRTHTLEAPGAVLTYDVRPNESSTEPVLLLIGSPMGAAGFGTLAGYFLS
jgi:hypothetical protein